MKTLRRLFATIATTASTTLTTDQCSWAYARVRARCTSWR
jgi:hypothetical protein